MRKAVVAVSVGVLLAASQAVAAGSNTAVTRVGDRVGAQSGESSDLLGLPLPVLLIGAAVLAAGVAAATDDDPKSA